MPRPGIGPGPSAWQATTLPRRYKSRLVPQSSTSVSFTYHYYIFPSPFRFVRGSQFEQPRNTRPPSLSGHQAHQMGLFMLGARCNRSKNSNHLCRDRGSNPCGPRDRRTLYHVAIKAGLYRKAVQVYHIPITATMYIYAGWSGSLLFMGKFYSKLCCSAWSP